MTIQREQPTFATREPVDFVVVGSGAAGGVVARELSTAGFDVVVLEQGPYVTRDQFNHDELGERDNRGFGHRRNNDPQSFRETENDETEQRRALYYLRVVGGTTLHFTANYWRFHEVDFIERSLLGPMAGTGFADWPITYDELEPYYTKVDWEVGVSGAPGPHSPRRDRVYGDRRPLILNLGLTAPKEVLLVMPVRLRKGNWKMGNGWGPGFSHPNFHLRIPIS